MKKILFFAIVCLVATQATAQNWQTINLHSEGLGVEIDFPRKPTLKKKEGNTPRYTYTVASMGLTFVLQATQKPGVGLPNSLADDSMKDILKSAARSEKPRDCNAGGFKCTEARYATKDGAYTNIRLIVVNDTVYQLMVMSMDKQYANQEVVDRFFNSAKFVEL